MRRVLITLVALVSTACAVGPNYQRPSTPVPTAYKEQGASSAAAGGQWKPAQPMDQTLGGRWWEVFGDPGLNALEEQVSVSNLTIAQSAAAYRAAAAAARGARAAFFPTVTATASAVRSSGVTRGTTAATSGAPPTATDYLLGVGVSWEADVFGRIRRTVEAGVAGAQASAADLAAVRLVIQAELAADYFALHGLDAQHQLLATTVAGYETALRLTTNRYNQGVASGVDVAQAQTQLETTRVQAIDLGVARAQLEHAIAVLLGKPPADFGLPEEPIHVVPPEIPVGLPSEILERRPDVAAAERRVAAANAEVGVATAGYFPILTLPGSGGYQSTALAGLFSLPNRFWSLGPVLAETLFDGGRRRSLKGQALAAYDGTAAAYREAVLGAFAEVEDDLATLRILGEEATQQAAAVAAAERSLTLAKNRYAGGITTYLEVVTAQTAALANERAAVDLLTRRMSASVDLMRAIGGGWRASDLPDRSGVMAKGAAPRTPEHPSAPGPHSAAPR